MHDDCMDAVTHPPVSREELVAALHARGLCYLAPTPHGDERPLGDDELIAGLAASPDARLRFALAALLLAHPALAERAAALIQGEAPISLSDAARAEMRKQYLAAMYLQRMWRTRLKMHFGETPLIQERFAKEMGLPPADAMFGELGLRALTERSAYNDWSSYEQVVDLLCEQPCATPDFPLPNPHTSLANRESGVGSNTPQ
ncbi:MAG: hypothetical protein KatS3mg053_0695 [Candidatus Roseilinea sp.]|jgi:hypothetical protein|nr:MAG: hypothetical protein KatS3mg053_0695 [Candidatus Roseilinea sp.]